MKLEFKNVTKQYGEVNAVNKVNCAMEKGIYGLLGVNGAGKTTLMRMLCTIVQQSEGQILWNGKDIWKPVSYTHLDVYKRQVQHINDVRKTGKYR